MYSSPDSKYRSELDGIRALAIVSVIAYHAGVPYFSRGFVGVDFFFVISGYLITSILAQEVLFTGCLDLKTFYARRIRRLIPAALFMLTICAALYAWFIPPVLGNYHALVRSVISNAFFASNFFFYRQTSGYFDESMAQFPLLHTWSLSVEEQYYLLWPLMIWGIAKWQAHSTAQHNYFHLIRKLRGLLWFLFVASLGFCIYYTTIDSKFAFYLLPARVWEFAAGGLLALYLLHVTASNEITSKQVSRTWSGTGLATLGVILCILSITYVDDNTLYYQGLWAVWPVAGTTALIAGLTLHRAGFWSRFFSFRPLVWLGLLSYGWYLWHWPLLTIYKIYSLGEDTLVLRILSCLVALVAAYVSYRFVEQPIRERRPWLFASAKGSLFAGGAMVLLMVSIAVALLASKEFQQLDPKHKRLEEAKDDRTDLAFCATPNHAFSELTICNTNTKGVDKKAPIIVLWGDSHADHFMATLFAKYPEHNIHKMVFPGCPPLIDDGLIVYNYKTACQAFNISAMAHIKSLGTQMDHLYLSARWPVYFGHAPISIAENTSTYPRGAGMYESMKFGLANVLTQLTQWSVKTTVLGATPELILNSPKCLMKRPYSTCDISRKLSDAYLNPSYTALRDIVRTSQYTKLIDMRSYFCNTTTCFSSRDGQPLYTDDNHITATTARELAAKLK